MTNDEFARAVQRPADQIDLALAALLFARDAYPELDPQLYLTQLDDWAAGARSAVTQAADPIAPLNEFLFGELRFVGNRVAYHDPLNSYLNKAIDRRVGLPITLSVIYLEIARRVGVPVEGIGLPGHFIVRYRGPLGARYIDPFNQGRTLTGADCARLVSELSNGQLTLQHAMLEPVSARHILIRMLNNLKNAQVQQGNFHAAEDAVERLIDLEPNEAAHVRDLGLLHYQQNHYGAALRHLQRYLTMDNADVSDPISEVIASCQTNLARLN